MECKNYQDMISLYMDNQLTTDENKLFEAHLAHCEECREELEFMQKLMMHVHDLDEDRELPSDFHGSLMDKIDRIQTTRHVTPVKKLNKVRTYYSAFAAAFVAVLIFGIIGIANLDGMNKMTKSEDSAAPEIHSESANESKNTTKEDSIQFDSLSDKKESSTSKDKARNNGANSKPQATRSNEPQANKAEETKAEPTAEEQPSIEETRDNQEMLTTDQSTEDDIGASEAEVKIAEEDIGITGQNTEMTIDITDSHVEDEEDQPLSMSIEDQSGDSNSEPETSSVEQIDEKSVTIQFNSESGTDRNNYSSVKNNDGANTNMNTLEKDDIQSTKVKETHKLAYMIIGIFGLVMLGAAFMVIVRKKRK